MSGPSIRGFACCNELYEHLPVVEGFRALRTIGYDAVELAPYTFGDPVFPRALAEAPAARAAAHDMGLRVLGLHWLFARTEGLHVHHPDAAVRRAAREHVLRCMDLCRALGGEILVMGSPPARALLPGESWGEAIRRTRDFFAALMPDADARGVTVAFEPLARHTSTFINTAAEALALMRGVGHPRFGLNLDTGALTDERRPPRPSATSRPGLRARSPTCRSTTPIASAPAWARWSLRPSATRSPRRSTPAGSPSRPSTSRRGRNASRRRACATSGRSGASPEAQPRHDPARMV